MKPDAETRKYNRYLRSNPQLVNKSYISSAQTIPPQKPKLSLAKTLKQQINPQFRQQWIAAAAYYQSAARGFSPGYEQTDWLAAEQEYIEMLVEKFLVDSREDGSMTIIGLRQLAKAIGIAKLGKIDSKLELIRLIQAASKHPPCFRAKPGEFCDHQEGCQWKTECQKLVAEWWR
jgi:hypothetical protein